MAKKKSKYVPTVQVASDDLVVLDDEGQEHRPHEGEWVRFRRSVPLRVMRMVARFGELDEADLEEQTAEYGAAAEELIAVLARQIVDWSWTDEESVPLPRPRTERAAFVEALWDLENYELRWLQEHLGDGAKVPNGSSSPSQAG